MPAWNVGSFRFPSVLRPGDSVSGEGGDDQRYREDDEIHCDGIAQIHEYAAEERADDGADAAGADGPADTGGSYLGGIDTRRG